MPDRDETLRALVAQWQQASVVAEDAYKAWDIACQLKAHTTIARHVDLKAALDALHAIERKMRGVDTDAALAAPQGVVDAPAEVWVSIDRDGHPVFAYHNHSDHADRQCGEEGDSLHRYLHAETVAMVNAALAPRPTPDDRIGDVVADARRYQALKPFLKVEDVGDEEVSIAVTLRDETMFLPVGFPWPANVDEAMDRYLRLVVREGA